MRAATSSLLVALVLALLAPSKSCAQDTMPRDTVPPLPTIAELLARLDDEPDMLHADYTPAVWALCAHGLEGAVAVLDALESPEVMTRLHASRVLSCGVSRHFGWRPGQGYPDGSAGEERFRMIWRDNGDYAHDAPAEARAASVRAWRAWLAIHRNDPPPPPARPSSEAVRAALDGPLAAARACVGTTTPVRIWAELTFGSSGETSRVRVHGARGAPARCIERALREGHVSPFTDPSFTIALGVIGR
jgi:hypothetical protein